MSDTYTERRDDDDNGGFVGPGYKKQAEIDALAAGGTVSGGGTTDYWDEFDVGYEALGEIGIMKPVYDDTGRIIGWNATGDINDPMERTYESLWGQLDEATGRTVDPITGDITYQNQFGDLSSWMNQQGYAMYDPMARDTGGQFTDPTMQNMQSLIDQLTQGPSAMELSQATAYAEQIMGMDPGTYAQIVGGLRQASEQDISQFQGMSAQERAVRERANRNELRGMEEMTTRMLDNIAASTGSTSRAYAAADQALGQINDAQIQQSLAIYNDDYVRKTAESDKAMQRYQLAVQNGQMSQAQYLDILNQNKSLAFQGYATQVNTMLQQNSQYLQQYQTDLTAISANIDNIYKAINMEMGIDEKIMQDIGEKYQMEIAPILTQMDMALTALQLQNASEAEKTASAGNFLTGVIGILGLIF